MLSTRITRKPQTAIVYTCFKNDGVHCIRSTGPRTRTCLTCIVTFLEL